MAQMIWDGALGARVLGLLFYGGLLTLTGCGGEVGEDPAGGEVEYSIPAGWVWEQPAGSQRRGQYRLPRVEGDPEDAEMVVFHFPGSGGAIQANVDRWIGQFSDPDGGPVTDSAKADQREVSGAMVTIVDVSGTYSPGPMTSAGSPKPEYRLLGAIIDTSRGPWFFKLTGPQKTVARWQDSFDQFVGSLKVN